MKHMAKIAVTGVALLALAGCGTQVQPAGPPSPACLAHLRLAVAADVVGKEWLDGTAPGEGIGVVTPADLAVVRSMVARARRQEADMRALHCPGTP